MKTAHTPGPWAHDDGHIFTEDKNREYNSIATVHEIYDNNKTPESNYKLIAAATELAEALQLIINNSVLPQHMVLMAEQALQKAGIEL